MASQNKPTAVHFTLIFFVMLSLILGVTTYMFYGDYKTEQAAAAAATTAKNTSDAAARRLDADVQALKAILGIGVENVGTETPDDPTTVLGLFRQTMTETAGPLVQPTGVDTLRKLREEINNLTAQRNSLQADLDDHKARLLALDQQKETRVTQFDTAARDARTDLQNRITSSEEAIASKQQEIDTLRTELQARNVEVQELNERLARTIEEKAKEIATLTAINTRLYEELNTVRKVSFEKEDGQLTWVDHRSRLVWINLGEADKLRKGTTFSVYSKGHHGVGRGAEDIKGSIEVTRVLGPHQAEARVTDEIITQPMAPGDPIYTPIWSPGRTEAFTLIGFIDLDKDKQSDRELLHEIIAATGASVDNEVDDQGNRTGTGVSVNTKFVVVGELPDPTTARHNEKEAAEAILKHYSDIQKEARLQAVRMISLNDFLSHLGYKPTQRNWRPGEEVPWLLKAGSQSTGVNESLGGDRTSHGNVSGQFQGSKRLGPNTSNGNTSIRGGYGR